MFLDENIKLLKTEFPGIDWDKLLQLGDSGNWEDIRVESSRIGLPTLIIKQDGREKYIHSKYDPYGEAERIAEKLENLENGKHVLFYGIGLGYLIQAVVKKYPRITFSIYEPDPRIFYCFLSQISLKKFPFELLNHIFIEGLLEGEKEVKYSFLRRISLNVALVTLPSYENILPIEFDEFKKEFLNSISAAAIDMRTRYKFEKDWVFNIIKNFDATLRTDNMIHKNKNFFKDKPVVIVSAGPSLEEEIENLKYIKQNGLAYIFSVGSAIKELLAHGIYPDAICAIDGHENNYKIYGQLIKDHQNKVPLIFGTFFYNKVVSDYSFKKFHLNIEVDTIADFYLNYADNKGIDMVKVVPSVAIAALQMLAKMECSPIILVGQNFAFKNEKYYSTGVKDYDNRTVAMTEQDKKEAFLVEDVDGGMVYTLSTLNVMRTQTELLIKLLDIKNVINTTRGGAKIEGTVYETLDSVIKNKLNDRIVSTEWLEQDVKGYDRNYLHNQYDLMIGEHKKVKDIIDRLSDTAEALLKVNYTKKEKTINNLLSDFGKSFSKLVKNKFYNVYLYKISTVEHDILLRDLEILASEENLVIKAQKAGEFYSDFMKKCRDNMEFISPLFDELNRTILEYLEEM